MECCTDNIASLHQENQETPPENRVGGFGVLTYFCTGAIWPHIHEPQQKTSTTSTKTVSGVVEWRSNDPIGISGGLNQYVAFGNNPVNYRDPDGRAVQAVALYVLGKGLIGGSLGALAGGISGLFDSSTGNLSLKNAGKGAATGFVGGFVAGAASTVPVLVDNLRQNIQDFTDGVIEDSVRQYEEVCP